MLIRALLVAFHFQAAKSALHCLQFNLGIPSESIFRKHTPNVGSGGILQGPLESFEESTVKSADGPNNALASVPVDGTHLHAQLSRNPKEGTVRRRRGSRGKAHSDPAAKRGVTAAGIAGYDAREHAMVC